MQYRVELGAIDRDGSRGRISLRFPAPVSFIAAQTATMVPAYNAIVPLTDATIQFYRGVWSDKITPISPAPAGINIQERVLFVIRTVNSDYYGFTIPAPKASIYEQTGDYAGMRVNSDTIALVRGVLDTFPLSDPITPGVPLEVDSIVGMREG